MSRWNKLLLRDVRTIKTSIEARVLNPENARVRLGRVEEERNLRTEERILEIL